MQNPFTWAGFGQWAFAASAFAFLLLVGWRWDRRRRAHERSGLAEIVAFTLTALWALVVAGIGTDTPLGQLFESFRSMGWLGLAFALFTRDGRDASVAPIRPMMAALLFVELLQPLLFMMTLRDGTNAAALGMIFHISVLFRLLVATGALVLVHNLYAGAMARQRAALRWTCAAMAMV